MIEFALFCFGASALLAALALDEAIRDERVYREELVDRIRQMKWSR